MNSCKQKNKGQDNLGQVKGWPPDKSRDPSFNPSLMFIQLVSFRIFLSFVSLRISIWTEKIVWHSEVSSCSDNRWSFCLNDKHTFFFEATFSSQWASSSHAWNFTEGSHAQSSVCMHLEHSPKAGVKPEPGNAQTARQLTGYLWHSVHLSQDPLSLPSLALPTILLNAN